MVVLGLIACGSPAEDSVTLTVVPTTDEPARPAATAPDGEPTTVPAPRRLPPSTSVAPRRPVTSEPRGTPIDHERPLVQAAREDLATRLGVPIERVMVVDARAMTWGDTSYGCPEPGMRYLSRVVEGALVVLDADGRHYEYHGGDPLQLCAHVQS